MKKVIIALCFFPVFLSSCAKVDQDPFKSFRSSSAEEIFQAAEKYSEKKDYSAAAKNFEALDSLYPFSTYAPQAHLDMIYAYFMDGDNASALAAVERYLRLYPRSEEVDYVYYMRGIINLDTGLSWLQKKASVDAAARDTSSLKEAYAAFATLVEQFPKSSYRAEALKKMEDIYEKLANREIKIAEFYLQRSAYVAAINRASYVVQNFKKSPTAVVKAMVILIKGYRQLGLESQAASSYEVLQKNFPDSAELKELAQLPPTSTPSSSEKE